MKIGDVVRLKSGGPLMTVHRIHDPAAPVLLNCIPGYMPEGEVACLMATSNGVFWNQVPEACLDVIDRSPSDAKPDGATFRGEAEAPDKPVDSTGPKFFL